MKRYSIIILCLLSFAFVMSVSNIYAIEVTPPDNVALPTLNIDRDGAGSSVVASIIAWMIRLTSILSIMAITVAAIRMVVATGDEEKVKKSKNMIIYAFVGLVIAGLAYAIVKFVV